MATKLNTIVFSIVVLHLLLSAHMHPIHLESPAPQPQPQPPQSQPQLPHHSSSQYGTIQGSLQPQECGPRCGDRCSNTQYKKPCLFFCNKCCTKCLCVPPGTYGNKQVCPCYNNWKTKSGGPKCP